MREEHPSHPEPDVAMIFRKSKHDMTVDIVDVENKLIKAMQEVSGIVTLVHANFTRGLPLSIN